MDERSIPQKHRGRTRDRSDQRRPTFHILNAVQPKTHTHGKQDVFGHCDDDYLTLSHYLHSGERQNKAESPPPHLQNRIIGMHTIGNKSCESVASSLRGPACNFCQNNNIDAANDRTWSQSSSPRELSGETGRSRSQSPQDRVVMEEPSDSIVWSASKKASRSNILCPLTDSEFRNINTKDTKTIMKAPRVRSTSAPGRHHHKQHPFHPPELIETKNSILFNVENVCKEAEEMLDDFAPPPSSPNPISPSASIASTTYSLQISLVTQQLEEIQKAQNDVLKHLGEEISKVTFENERLNKELEHVRDQNEGLLKVVHDTSDELERMKQIFRTRGLSHQKVLLSGQQEAQDDSNNVYQPSSALPAQYHQRHHQRSNKKQHLKQQGQGEKRDNVNSNSNSRKSSTDDGDPAVALMHETGENSHLKQPDEGKPNKQIKNRGKKHQLEQQHEKQTTGDDLDVIVADEDDNASHRSVDSQHDKSSGKRRSDRQHRHNRSPRQSHANCDSEPRRHSRSRSKERQIKSPRTSNCSEQGEIKARPLDKSAYLEDCNEDIEVMQGNEGESGCFRAFTCCWSSSRTRTDSMDDIHMSRINNKN